MIDFIDLGVAAQISLGAGYLSYCTAYAGFRRHHQARDAIFITLVFAAIASAIASAIMALPCALGIVPAYIFSVLVAFLFAIAWRGFGRDLWHKLMRALKVHREDGVGTTWENLVQTDKFVDQVSVHLSDGRILYLNNRPKYASTPCARIPWDGLYLGSDGSVLMIVEEEKLPDGAKEERQEIFSAQGTLLTYIPASEITRVNMRLK